MQCETRVHAAFEALRLPPANHPTALLAAHHMVRRSHSTGKQALAFSPSVVIWRGHCKIKLVNRSLGVLRCGAVSLLHVDFTSHFRSLAFLHPSLLHSLSESHTTMLFSQLSLLASAALLTNAAPVTKRQATTCASGVNIIHARGSTESQETDETLSVVSRLLAAIPGSIETDVDYPAAIISEDSFYSTSVADGVDDLKDKIKGYADACGDEARIVLLGYSQGGNVISTALSGGFVRPIPLDPRYKKYSK